MTSGLRATTGTGSGAANRRGSQSWKRPTTCWLIADADEHFSIPGHGDLGRDLRDYLGQLAVFLGTTDAGAVFRAWRARPARPRRRGPLPAEVLAPQRERDRAPFLAAIERGQLAAWTDFDLAVDQVVGPLYHRVLITGESVTAPFTDALVDRYLAGLTHPAKSAPAQRQ
jgi:Tetracyclin repressor-like, C-terminal domain